MRGINTSIQAIERANRLRAVSKTTVKGGEAGQRLAKQARLSQEVMPGMVMVDGEQKPVFILGMHPMTNDYVVL